MLAILHFMIYILMKSTPFYVIPLKSYYIGCSSDVLLTLYPLHYLTQTHPKEGLQKVIVLFPMDQSS